MVSRMWQKEVEAFHMQVASTSSFILIHVLECTKGQSDSEVGENLSRSEFTYLYTATSSTTVAKRKRKKLQFKL